MTKNHSVAHNTELISLIFKCLIPLLQSCSNVVEKFQKHDSMNLHANKKIVLINLMYQADKGRLKMLLILKEGSLLEMA